MAADTQRRIRVERLAWTRWFSHGSLAGGRSAARYDDPPRSGGIGGTTRGPR